MTLEDSKVDGTPWPPSLLRHWRERYEGGVRAATNYAFTSPPPQPYHEELMAVAREMLATGNRPELVVIVAQMACEVFAAQVIDVLIGKKSLQYLEGWIDKRLPNSNLANETVRLLYESLCDDKLGQWPQWSDYKSHSERRNKIVHEGLRIDAAQSKGSFEVCEALLKHLMGVIG